MAIVPTATRDSTGMFVPDQSILDQRISFPEMGYNLQNMLQAFCRVLSTATGKHVYTHVGDEPTNVHIGAKDEVARDVLARMFTTHKWIGMGILVNSSPGRSTIK